MIDRGRSVAARLQPSALPLVNQHARSLPTPLASLIGRKSELDEIRRLVLREGVRLVSLVGPGGVGKTRLALEVAGDLRDHFPDGVFVVWLAPLRDPSLVLSTIAQALGLREEGTYPIAETLADHLRPMRALLLLDNFEHLLDAVPEVVALLEACPRVKVLATSRAALGVFGGYEYHVQPLALPALSPLPPVGALRQVDAVRLFTERARAIQPSFSLTSENAATLAAICHRLDGLPLALELAAARTRVLQPAALLDRLSSRLSLLAGGSDLPARHRTMRVAIGWSYDLLSRRQQTLFSRLSVFSGGCSLDGTEAVCGSAQDRADQSGAAMLDDLEALVAHSLIQQEEIAESPRFSMLETIREFGLERLSLSGEAEELRRRHAEHFLRVAEAAEAAAAEAEDVHQGYQRPGWLASLARDEDNFRAAHDWAIREGQATTALRLSSALWRYWYFRGQLSEGRQRLDQALRLAVAREDEVYLRARAFGLEASSRLAQLQHDYRAALGHLVEGLALARRLGDLPMVARMLQQSGVAAFHLGDAARARSSLDESIEVGKAAASVEVASRALGLRALVAHSDGDLEAARQLVDESILLQRMAGRRPNDEDLLMLGCVMIDQGDVPAGRAVLEELREFERARGFRRGIGATTLMVGAAALAAGNLDEARSLTEEGLVIWHGAGEWGGRAWVISCCAAWAAAAGKREEATRLARAAAALWRKGGAPVSPCLLTRLANVLKQLGHSLDEGSETLSGDEASITFESAVAYARATLRQPTSGGKASTAHSTRSLRERLTRRELEVAELVAEGLTNREIAERLVLAERTVTTHVEHIFDKMGYHSRAQIAAWIAARLQASRAATSAAAETQPT